jgi:hypothetical protein
VLLIDIGFAVDCQLLMVNAFVLAADHGLQTTDGFSGEVAELAEVPPQAG